MPKTFDAFLMELRDLVDRFIDEDSIPEERPVEVKKDAPVPEPELDEVEEAEEEAVDLNSMRLAELRKYYKELTGDEPPAGGKPLIISAIEKLNKAEKAEITSVRKTRAAKSTDITGVDEEEIEDTEETEADEDLDIQEEIEALLDGLTESEVKNVANALGVSKIGRRQGIIAGMVDSISDGTNTINDVKKAVAALESDEEETEEETPVTAKRGRKPAAKAEPEPEEEEVEDDGDEDELPPYDTDDMTDKRAEAIEALTKKIKSAIRTKKISDAQMNKFCKEFYAHDPDAELDDITEAYIQAKARMIDDEGETHGNEEVYDLNGMMACCGYYCNDVKDDPDSGICPVCGQIYTLTD